MCAWAESAFRLVHLLERALLLISWFVRVPLCSDEVDAFLTKRGASSEHEATLQAKTEFMQLWDGMESLRGVRVLVMGATNRPWMVDEAVLRWGRKRVKWNGAGWGWGGVGAVGGWGTEV